ncbi:hypothetical protein R3P38DRAFT_3359135 [Favolaschia claudopus]|uniref:DUF6535 domain-containing protein n=1 Tax=Favolaschia claudopus TaxID=2862362 RepID=A0AAW0B1H7_9AGAR
MALDSSDDEAATAKMWAIYASEAEKYDKGLVESWKSDMEGILIFAGLFSAVLTAFLIESYKTLNPDPEDLTVLLLTRISEQIVASAHGNASHIPPPLELNDNGPTRTALACNALWFLSLGLSLSCALIATLLEQWAREFLHRTDIHSAPVIRARVFSFLYYGLRRFNMHAVVDIIPFLLHLSLLLFFSGLIAFLVPVNTGIALIAAVMLFVVAATYSVLTVFPLRYLDSPYRTPLTGLFWRSYQYFKIRWNRQHSPPGPVDEAAHSEIAVETMVAAISRVAAEPSDERVSRDLKALVWTVKSLADDTEFEPFVDAISDILWGLQGCRTAHYAFLHNLVNNPQTLLHARIINLYRSCDAGILTPVALKRRKIICCKALWTTIGLLEAPDSYGVNLKWLEEKDSEVLQYIISAEAMVCWNVFEKEKHVLNTHLESLERLQAMSEGVQVGTVARDWEPSWELGHIRHFMSQLMTTACYMISTEHLKPLLLDQVTVLDYDSPKSPDRQISVLLGNFRHILTTTPHVIFLRYLRSASMLDTVPYLFSWTLSFLRPPHSIPPIISSDLDATFEKIVPRLLDNFNSAEPGWMDLVMDELLLCWHQQVLSDRITLHSEFLRYLNNRCSKAAISIAMRPMTRSDLFWQAFVNTLANPDRLLVRDSLTAAWQLVSATVFPPLSLIPRLIDACMATNNPSIPPSLIAVFKWQYVSWKCLSLCATDPADVMHQWLATIATSPSDPDVNSSTRVCDFSADDPLDVADGDACVVLYAEYLETCARLSDTEFPHEAMTTLRLMDTHLFHSSQIHDAHQIRFANALRHFFESAACKHLRFTVIANTWLFRPYLNPHWQAWGAVQWLDDQTARDSVIATLTQYIDEMEGSEEADTDKVVRQTHTVLNALR